MAALVNGGRLPEHVLPFCAVAALVAAALPFVGQYLQRRQAPDATRWEALLPSSIGFAVCQQHRHEPKTLYRHSRAVKTRKHYVEATQVMTGNRFADAGCVL